MKNLYFGHGHGHGRNVDHLTTSLLKFWPWSKIFDHMIMTVRRPNGQKIMVALLFWTSQDTCQTILSKF